MRVIEKREQKADDDGFDAPPFEQTRRLDDFRLGERNFDRPARRQDALGHRDAVSPFDQGPLLPGNFEMQRKIVWPLMPADMEDVAEVSRRQHPNLGAVMLDGDIGRDRRPVHDQRYIVGSNAGNLAKFAQALEYALRLIVRRTGDLMDENAMIGLENEVRIGSADIDANARHESPIVLAPPCQTRAHNAVGYSDFNKRLSAMVGPCNP